MTRTRLALTWTVVYGSMIAFITAVMVWGLYV